MSLKNKIIHYKGIWLALPNERFITGTFPCNSPKCHLCPNINTNPTITGPKESL